MLLDLRQSPLAAELGVASAAIVSLLEAIARDGADYESAMAAWRHPTKPPRRELEAVLSLPLAERQALWRAVEADIRFEESIEDERFEFQFPGLDAGTGEVGGRLLRSMYKTVFSGSGFALAADVTANRTSWEAAFREANPNVKVCPACLLAKLERRIEGRAAVDADHYLPKALYPALSVHGLNLVPICKPCNETAKREKDPLASGEGRQPITSVWFPYRRPGIVDMALEFTPKSEAPQALVRLSGTGDGERKARLFDDLFSLSQRWSESLEEIHNRISRTIRDFLEGELNLENVEAKLRQLARTYKGELEQTTDAYVTGCYCEWMVESPGVLAALVEELAAGDNGVDPTL